MRNSTPDGWVTHTKIPLHDGRVIIVQKRNGSTRTLIVPATTGAHRS